MFNFEEEMKEAIANVFAEAYKNGEYRNKEDLLDVIDDMEKNRYFEEEPVIIKASISNGDGGWVVDAWEYSNDIEDAVTFNSMEEAFEFIEDMNVGLSDKMGLSATWDIYDMDGNLVYENA